MVTPPKIRVDHVLDARRGVFYRPVKQQITLRIDADIITWFKAGARDGRGYQTDINGALRKLVKPKLNRVQK